MDLTLEGLPLLILFLLPGFFVFHTRKYLNPATDYQYSNFELGLLSLGYSTLISALQAVLFLWVLSYWPVVDIPGLWLDPVSQLRLHPLLYAIVLLAWVVVSVFLALAVGIFDPYHALLTLLHRRAHITNKDIWYGVLQHGRESLGQNAVAFAVARLKNRDVYFGVVDKFETIAQDSGDRIFSLKDVHYHAGGAPDPGLVSMGTESYVLLNTRDIESIEVYIRAGN